MCKGSLKTRAECLFDLILGPELVKANIDHSEDHDIYLAWRSGRMTLVFKKIVWFSEIFPKKF
jgi:hypothetical protein